MTEPCLLCGGLIEPTLEDHNASPAHRAALVAELGLAPALLERDHAPQPTVRASLAAEVQASCDLTEAGCWLWPGAMDQGSPVAFRPVVGKVRLRRLMYEERVAPIIRGAQPKDRVATTCSAERCVAPAHLELIDSLEAARRARVAVGRERTPREADAADRRADAIRHSFAEKPTTEPELSTLSDELSAPV